MSDYVTVLALAALPAVANVGGGLLAEVLVIRRRTIGLVFQWVAGMLLGVVGVELMPRALRATHPWLVVLAFIMGGGFFLLLEEEILPKKKSDSMGEAIGRPWALFAGILVDLFITGVVIGAGVTVERKLGVLLAISLLVVDAPEGFLTIANLRSHGVTITTRLILLAALGASVFLGATVGYAVLRGHDPLAKLALLAFAAGMLLTLVADEMLPEARESGDVGIVLLLGGFAVTAALSVYVG